MKKVISLVAALSIMFTTSALAKSNDLIDPNIDKMRAMLNEEMYNVYVESSADNYVYFGAKFEPRSGVLLGTPGGCEYPGVGNAVTTSYEWFTPSDEISNDRVARKEIPEVKSNHTEAVGINWNFASQQPVDMSRYENYIKNYIDELASRGKDIFLIFGKEMNIDDNFIDEQVFIDCFKYVADYAHTKENIAMVWSPNDTGGLDTRLIDFYPGDEYVDWIGCSMYSSRYFLGNKNADEGSNIGFIMGPYANPVMRAKVLHNFATENGINKPMMITEGGVGYQDASTGEDYTDWATQQLRRYYGEIVRVFPEFKCIISFNNHHPSDKYRFDMGSNPQLLDTIVSYTKDPVYIQDYTETSDVSYVQMYDGMELENTIKLSAVGYQPKVEWMNVKYKLDGNEVFSTDYPPYKYELTNVPEGNHNLTTEFYVGGQQVKSLSYDFYMKNTSNRVYSNEEYNGGCNFSDMENMSNEMKNAVASLSAKGIINGIGDNKFGPELNVTRAEVAAMLVRALGLSGGENDFTDVSTGDWYYSAVSAAKKAGMIDGFEDGTFRPLENVTNEQLVAILAKYLISNGESVPDISLNCSDFSSWAEDYIKLAHKKSIVIYYENNAFKGEEKVTRGDCAVMINRFLNGLS